MPNGYMYRLYTNPKLVKMRHYPKILLYRHCHCSLGSGTISYYYIIRIFDQNPIIMFWRNKPVLKCFFLWFVSNAQKLNLKKYIKNFSHVEKCNTQRQKSVNTYVKKIQKTRSHKKYLKEVNLLFLSERKI